MRNLVVISLLLVTLSARSQYLLSEIPKDLLENANAVVRLDQATYEVLSNSSGKYIYKQIVTILNKNGERHSAAVVGYDKLSRARITVANIFNRYGKRIYKLKKSDVVDRSSISGGSIYEDNRLKYVNLSHNDYPYTVEYEYEVEYNFLYSIPNWYVAPDEHTSVQKSNFLVKAPNDLLPRFKGLNFDSEKHFNQREEGGSTIYEWHFENIAAKEREPYGPGLSELNPIVYIAPSNFNFDGYEGDMSSWDSFSEWILSLNYGRDKLPVETVQEISKQPAKLDNDRDKVRLVYEYLQANTRYVSIQLGIGGFQPFEAEVVDELGYGDCKALSNYTQSLLSAVGVESIYTLVDAGSNPREIDRNFAIPNFNHAILCVPNKGDTLWLECTSQTNPFAYMGSFTGDRDVLLVTKDGGKIGHTPIYDETVNKQVRRANVKLASNGDAALSVSTKFSGLKYEHENLNFVVDMGEKDKKEWVAENTQLPNFDLDSYEFKITKDAIPEAEISANYSLSRYGKPNGKRLFLSVNLMNRIERLPKPVEDRKTDFLQKNAFTEIDSITYTFDENFNFEFVPEDVKFESKFGSYESSIVRDKGKMIFMRKYILRKGRYPAEDYERYRDFLRKVIKADAGKVVLNGTT